MRLNKIPQRFISFPKPQTVTFFKGVNVFCKWNGVWSA